MTKIHLTNDQLMDKIYDWLTEADADEFSRIAGEIFGGECLPDGWESTEENILLEYSFEPNGDYWGAFEEEMQ